MILGVDPKVDYAFKYLFGRDSTRAILIDMLNNVLDPPPGHEIVEIELLNPFNLQETLNDKLSILDIKARDQSGRQFNIEMQMLPYPDYGKRIVYYWAKFHQQQLHEGDDYAMMRPTISISFLNHLLFPEVLDYHLRFRLLETRRHFPLSEDIEFHLLELPKFNKTLAELESGLDIWLYFLRFAEKIDEGALPTVLQQLPILRAVEELKMLTQSDIDRERYEARRKAQHDHISFMGHARREGQKIGQEIGKMVGAIQAYEQMLHQPETPEEQLLALPMEELTRRAEALRNQALNKQ